MDYPAEHFPGTSHDAARWVRRARVACAVGLAWQVPMEAIARFESDCDPNIPPEGDLRGMMQQSVGQYAAAKRAGFIRAIDYTDPAQAVVVAIRYVQSKLPGYGGYHGLAALLKRDDRGPGDVLRWWIANPRASYSTLRPFYHGY